MNYGCVYNTVLDKISRFYVARNPFATNTAQTGKMVLRENAGGIHDIHSA